MSVATLRRAIADRTRQLLVEKLEDIGIIYHKKHWRDCECSWCATKREATDVIAHTRGYQNNGVVYKDGSRSWNDGREATRHKYRSRLKALEEDNLC